MLALQLPRGDGYRRVHRTSAPYASDLPSGRLQMLDHPLHTSLNTLDRLIKNFCTHLIALQASALTHSFQLVSRIAAGHNVALDVALGRIHTINCAICRLHVPTIWFSENKACIITGLGLHQILHTPDR
ncbi:hypothetical protein D3C85_1499270 [compost metagenome]